MKIFFSYLLQMPENIQQLSDEDLLSHYRMSGDKQVVGELFKRHTLLCFAVCNKYLKNEDASNDAVMQIFENLFVLLAQHQIANFRNWLHSVARNHCLMMLRKPELFLSIHETEEENENSFMEKHVALHQEENKEEQEKKWVALESALLDLNQKQHDCLRLFYLEQLSYEEVSERTKLSLNEVKSAIQNGKRNLKINLQQKGISYFIAWAIWIQQSA
jgi:RNA polymerase sigma-70 factor (ECF subfamily)